MEHNVSKKMGNKILSFTSFYSKGDTNCTETGRSSYTTGTLIGSTTAISYSSTDKHIQARPKTLSNLTQLFQLFHPLQRTPRGVNKVMIFTRYLNRHKVKVRPNIKRAWITTRTNIHPWVKWKWNLTSIHPRQRESPRGPNQTNIRPWVKWKWDLTSTHPRECESTRGPTQQIFTPEYENHPFGQGDQLHLHTFNTCVTR